MPHDFGCDFGAAKKRLSDHDTGVAVHEMNLVELDPSPDVSGQALDLNRRTCFDPILFTTRFNDCVHIHISTLEERFI